MELVKRQRNNSQLSQSVFYVLLMSDIHNNRAGLQIAQQQLLSSNPRLISAVLLAGDMVHLGSAEEAASVFKDWPRAKIPVFFVGGNHEGSGAMRELEKFGFIHLTTRSLGELGLVLAGQDEPLADSFAMASDDSALAESSLELLEYYQAADPKPSLVLVHDIQQAEALIEEARKQQKQLVVAYGHHHELKVEQSDTVVTVQAGTAGASGFEAIGRNPDMLYSYQILEFTKQDVPKLVGVYSYIYDDNNDAFNFSRTPID
jgi:predicted phosphodiesterase